MVSEDVQPADRHERGLKVCQQPGALGEDPGVPTERGEGFVFEPGVAHEDQEERSHEERQ